MQSTVPLPVWFRGRSYSARNDQGGKCVDRGQDGVVVAPPSPKPVRSVQRIAGIACTTRAPVCNPRKPRNPRAHGPDRHAVQPIPTPVPIRGIAWLLRATRRMQNLTTKIAGRFVALSCWLELSALSAKGLPTRAGVFPAPRSYQHFWALGANTGYAVHSLVTGRHIPFADYWGEGCGLAPSHTGQSAPAPRFFHLSPSRPACTGVPQLWSLW
jgi:hypothetical protein